MKSAKPVSSHVRLAISQWPDDAPRGAVTTFCVEQGISRKTFYALRARAQVEGPAAILEPRSRRPKTSPTRISDEVRTRALQVRAALERSGLDHGPVSVFEKMRAMELTAPSVAALARIFRAAGVARMEPRKRPRAAYRRFVYPAPNACWQLDATEYVLAGGRKCVIFQLEDDHSRLEVASHVAATETSAGALAVVKKGIATRGIPQRLLTDNGMALNPSRRGWEGQLVAYVTSLGIQAITGRPGRPTTQGKNERLHQTLFRFLDKQPLAQTLVQLQEQVDRFDLIYNTERPHQGLPGRITPQQSWDATTPAESPRPRPAPSVAAAPAPKTEASNAATQHVAADAAAAAARKASLRGHREIKVQRNGVVYLRAITFMIDSRRAGLLIHAIWDPTGVVFADTTGEVILERPWPVAGTTYVSNGVRSGRRNRDESVTEVLRHQLPPKR